MTDPIHAQFLQNIYRLALRRLFIIKMLNNLIHEKIIHPVLGATYSFNDLPKALQLMHDNQLPCGSTAIKIGYA